MDSTKIVAVSSLRALAQDGFTSWAIEDKKAETFWIIGGSSVGYSSIGLIKKYLSDYISPDSLPYMAAAFGGALKYAIIKHSWSNIFCSEMMIASAAQVLLEVFKESGMGVSLLNSIESMTAVQIFNKTSNAWVYGRDIKNAATEGVILGLSKGVGMWMVTSLVNNLPQISQESTEEIHPSFPIYTLYENIYDESANHYDF